MWPASTIAPAEQPARTAPRSCASASARPTALPSSTLHQVARLAARQVDQVGLADRLGRGRIVGARGRGRAPARPRRRAAPKCATPIAAQRVKTVLAVGVGGRRQDRDAWPGATRRGEQAGVELGHRGEELAGADERHGSGHGRESTHLAAEHDRARLQLPTLAVAGMTTRQRWTLDLHGHRVRRGLPRRHDRQPALKHIGQELPGLAHRRPRGPGLHRQRLPGGAGRAAHPGRRAVRPLRPAPGLRHRPRRVRRDVGAVRPGADARDGWSSSASLQGAAGALLIPGSLALITHAFDGARAPGRSASGRRRRAALTVLGPIVGGTLVDTPAGGWRSSSTSRCSRSRCGRRVRHVQESRDTESTGRFDWLGAARRGAGRRRPRVRGHPRPGQRLGGHGRLDRHRGRCRVARRLPDPDGPPPEPARPARAVPESRAFASINLATFFIYGGLYVTFFYQAVILQGVLGYTALGAGLIGLPTRGHAGARCRPGSARWPGGYGVAPVPRRGAAADGRRPALVRAAAGALGAVEGVDRGPGQPHPADRPAHRRPSLRRSCSGLGSRASSRR